MRRILLGAVLVLLVAACSADDAESTNDDTLRVVATTTVTADFARVIGGARVSVHGIAKPNVDLHDLEPSPADINAMRRAQVIVINGAGLERRLEATVAASGTKATIADSSEGVVLRIDEHHDDEADPHIWHDPRNAKTMVTNIARAFIAADPAGAADYERNLAAYLAQLDRLDQDIAAQVATLDARKLVTNHDAFGYFVDRYGFEFVGSIIPSFDTSAEMSASGITALVDAIKAAGVKAVFSESSLPAKTAQTIAREAGVKVVAGEDALYGDGLGPAGSPGGTYLEMMQHNADAIVRNLR